MLLFIITILIILLIIILFLPLHIVITIKIGEMNLFNIKIKIFNKIVVYKYNIPIENVINNTSNNSSKNNDNKNENNRCNTKKNILKIIEEIVNNLESALKRAYCNYEEMAPILKYLQYKFRITNLKWITHVGLDDAAFTAVTTGVLWNIKMKLYSILTSYLSIEDFNIDIKPVYNKKVLDIDFYCIIKLKIVYIIIAGLKVKLLKRKGCASNVRTSN